MDEGKGRGCKMCYTVNDKAAGPIFHDKKAKPKNFMLHIWP